MMQRIKEIEDVLRRAPRSWLITGVAGFIGSNLLEYLLGLDQQVHGLDNFETGHQRNLDDVFRRVQASQWNRFTFQKGDIRELADCKQACTGVSYVLHQAALGSVPRSLEHPLNTNQTNVTGFLNMLVAARDAQVKRFVYAASSSTYGDHPALPKVEAVIGNPLSPYAVTKYVNELYASVFNRSYGLSCIGLRYFNVFGPRQDPNGAYAAVIPRWYDALLKDEPVYINGSGDVSRDFCFVDNAVQANVLAAFAPLNASEAEVFNVAVGDRTTLIELFQGIKSSLAKHGFCSGLAPIFREARKGDVLHSQADIRKARVQLGYEPTHRIADGLDELARWFLQSHGKSVEGRA